MLSFPVDFHLLWINSFSKLLACGLKCSSVVECLSCVCKALDSLLSAGNKKGRRVRRISMEQGQGDVSANASNTCHTSLRTWVWVLRTQRRSHVVVHVFNPHAPAVKSEVETEYSLEVGWPASCLYNDKPTRRPCLKQGGRWGPASKVAL